MVTGQYQSGVSVLANKGLVLTTMANLGKKWLFAGMVCPSIALKYTNGKSKKQ